MNSVSFQKVRLLTIIENYGYIDVVSGSKMYLGATNYMTINFSEWVEIVVLMKFGLQPRMCMSALNYHSQ